MKSDVIILMANYDKTSSFGKGSNKGPSSILKCLDEQIEVFERFTKTKPIEELKIERKNLGDLNNLSPEEMVEKINVEFSEAKKNTKLPILLGGEHSISNGVFKSLEKNSNNITILQIDAHQDLRNDDSDYNNKPYGKYAHSAVMRRASEMGFKIVQVGIRAYSEEEYEYSKKNNIKVFEWNNDKPKINDIINSIETDDIYLTLDVDGIDPSHMPATGTPVQGGLEWYYTINLLKELFEKKNVIGADIVEVAPKENDSLTEYGAAQILYNIIAFNFK